MRCYIFDLDGTLADHAHRLHHTQKTPKDWRAFFAACGDDPPIPHMVELCRSLSDLSSFEDYPRVIFVSGRRDEVRQQTIGWLDANDLWDYERSRLYMRKEGDYRADDIVKLELLAQIRADGFEPVLVFDDRARVVKAFRDAGVPVAQVAEGDF